MAEAVRIAALPENPDLDQLRRRARELQRAVVAGDVDSVRRVQRILPPESSRSDKDFRLTTAQLVIAREHGFTNWARLRRYVGIVTAGRWSPKAPPAQGESVADQFLRLACATSDEGEPWRAATDLLGRRPDLPGSGLAIAAACADTDAIRHHLTTDPSAATRRAGPHDWSPLLYLAGARLRPGPDRQASLAAATLLLDAGADPNDGRFWHALPTPFTALTLIFGDGRPGTRSGSPHPHAIPLARLLLERGADPNDGQALYNRMFATNDDHLRLLFEFGLGTPQGPADADGEHPGGPWFRLLGEALEPPVIMLRTLLFWAVLHGQGDRAVLLADHGVDIAAPFNEPRTGPARGLTPAAAALINGHSGVAERLIARGAPRPRLTADDAFVAAVLGGDEDRVLRAPADAVARVRCARPGLIVWAAAVGPDSAVELLAGNGFDVNAFGRGDLPSNQPWHTALHEAVARGRATLVSALLELGADPALTDTRFGGTPLDWAHHFGRTDLADLLTA